MTIQELMAILNTNRISDPERVQRAVDTLRSVDQVSIRDKYDRRLKIKVWDKTSKINGADPSLVMAEAQVPADATVFLIYDSGNGDRVIVVQPILPKVQGVVLMEPNSPDDRNSMENLRTNFINMMAMGEVSSIVLSSVGL